MLRTALTFALCLTAGAVFFTLVCQHRATAQHPGSPIAPLEITTDQRLVTVYMDRLPADAGVLIASDTDGHPMRLTCSTRIEDETAWVCKRYSDGK